MLRIHCLCKGSNILATLKYPISTLIMHTNNVLPVLYGNALQFILASISFTIHGWHLVNNYFQQKELDYQNNEMWIRIPMRVGLNFSGYLHCIIRLLLWHNNIESSPGHLHIPMLISCLHNKSQLLIPFSLKSFSTMSLPPMNSAQSSSNLHPNLISSLLLPSSVKTSSECHQLR